VALLLDGFFALAPLAAAAFFTPFLKVYRLHAELSRTFGELSLPVAEDIQSWFWIVGLAATWMFVYGLVRDGFGGSSWGKRMVGAMVVQLGADRPCTGFRSLVRHGLLPAAVLAGVILARSSGLEVLEVPLPMSGTGPEPVPVHYAAAALLLLDPLVLLLHPRNRRLSDLLTGTQVIYRREFTS
jgi:uncharacterized RDD family membrane protein YckC